MSVASGKASGFMEVPPRRLRNDDCAINTDPSNGINKMANGRSLATKMMMTTTTFSRADECQWEGGSRFRTLSSEMKEIVSRILSLGAAHQWTSLADYGWELEDGWVWTIGEMIW